MAMIMTEAQRPQVGEYHHRRVIEQIASPNPTAKGLFTSKIRAWRAVLPLEQRSAVGQNAKYSSRADVFRSTPESGLKSDIAS
jgi:hypothetical protein